MERLGGCAPTECRGRAHEVTNIHAVVNWYPIGYNSRYHYPVEVCALFFSFFLLPPIGPLLDLGETALDHI
jgi:hypothetical protein